MMFERLRNSFLSTAQQNRRRQSRPPLLKVEPLEDRRLLATFTVTNNTDGPVAAAGDLAGSLRQAIFDANTNPGDDTIEFDSLVFTGGNASLVRLTAGELEITETLTIDGSAATDVTITGDASNNDVTNVGSITVVTASDDLLLADNSRVLNFSASLGDLTLDSLVLTGGRTTGNNATSSDTLNSGGGLRFASDGKLELANSTVSGNSTTGERASGGGIVANNGLVTLVDSTVSRNSTTGDLAYGGGIHTLDGAVTLLNSTIASNRTEGSSSYGGGISTRAGSVILTDSSLVDRNSTTGDNAQGGGIFTRFGDVSLVDSSLNLNTTTGFAAEGGGVAAGGDVTLFSSTVFRNSTAGDDADGGGIRTGSGVVTVNNSSLTTNFTTGSMSAGGGIRTSSGNVNLSNSTLAGNNTAGSGAAGGGIYTDLGVVSLDSSILDRNSTAGDSADGGGIRAARGGVSLVNSTISGNSVQGTNSHGGGIRLFHATSISRSFVSFDNSTVTDNFARGLGGGLSVVGGRDDFTLTIRNSIVADNSDGGTGDDLSVPSVPMDSVIVSHSLIGRNSGTTLVAAAVGSPDVNGNLIGTRSNPIDPLLGRLADNSGETKTHALQPGSPAINAGDPAFTSPSTFDQRGAPFSRAADGRVDMGAYELHSLPAAFFVVTTATDELDYSNAEVSLREAIESANGSLGDDTITFDSAVFTGANASLIRLTRGALSVSESLIIDGSTGVDVTITGDANNDDITDSANITDIATTGDALLEDNSGVLFFSPSSSNAAENLTLVGLTITGGLGGGVSFQSRGTLSLTNVSVVGNSTLLFLQNASGGGISGPAATGAFPGSSLELTNSRVSGNRASRAGGGIGWNGSATLINSIVSENSIATKYVNGFGGGIWMGSRDATNTLTLIDSIVRDNDSGISSGGGISTFASAVMLDNSTVSGNSANVSDNFGLGGKGGGIYSREGAVTLNNSTVSGNRVDGSGLLQQDSSGGGIHTSNGAVTLFNSTVSGNSSGGQGGGILTMTGEVTLRNSTVTGNSTEGAGGGVFFYESIFSERDTNPALVIENSIVAGNSDNGAAVDVPPDRGGPLTINHSLIGNTLGSGITSTTGTGNVLDQDALLGPLAFNGGPTKTHALLPGSPAIDAGNSTESFDQRGLPRVIDLPGVANAAGSNNADIGAFERQAIEPIGTFPVVSSFARDEGGVLARPDLLTTISFSFDVDVNVDVDDLIIRNDSLGGTEVDNSDLTLSYNPSTNTATWDFGSLTLDPAFYSLELSSDIVSAVGNLSLDGDVDGNPGGAFVESVYVALPGDANLDGKVDVLGDAAALVNNLGATAGALWADGDFNGDGAVNVLGDAAILVNRLGQSVVPTMTALASVAFVTEPVSFVTDQEDDRQPASRQWPSLQQPALAGSQDLDAAFASDDLFGDAWF